MRCSCGAEIPAGARFCGKCGKMVENDPGRHCSVCGALLIPGAAFCGKCGTAVSASADDKAARCRACGAILYPGAKFCGKCRTPVSGDPVRETADYPAGGLTREEAASSPAASGTDDRNRIKKIFMIALVVGLCLAVAGAAGKIAMGKITGILHNYVMNSGAESEMKMILGEDTESAMESLVVSITRNDPASFTDMITRAIRESGTQAGEMVDMAAMRSMINSFAQEAFGEARNEIIKEAGAYWPLLQVIACYRELLIIGLVIAAAAAAAWLLLGGKPGDFKELKMMPALYILAGWVVLVAAATVIGLSALNSRNI